MQDSILIKKKHKRFIKTVCESEVIYVLKSKKGFATSSSIEYEDNNGDPVAIICFWAEKSLAKSCIKDNWKKYRVVEISLIDFMEDWCIGIDNDDLLIGTQFDQNMYGYEAEPLKLILDLTTELNLLEKDLDFKKFNGISDLEKQVREAIK